MIIFKFIFMCITVACLECLFIILSERFLGKDDGTLVIAFVQIMVIAYLCMMAIGWL